MQTKQASPMPERVDRDAETEQAMLAQWQRRARAFAWACGMRVDRVGVRDED